MDKDLPLEKNLENNINSSKHMLNILHKISNSLDNQCYKMESKCLEYDNRIDVEDMECATELSNSYIYIKNTINQLQDLLKQNLNIMYDMKEK